jgi:hypothetical protein
MASPLPLSSLRLVFSVCVQAGWRGELREGGGLRPLPNSLPLLKHNKNLILKIYLFEGG